MTEPELIESEDTRYLKVGIRKISRANEKMAQRFLRQFRLDMPERWTDTAGKIEYIYRVVFASRGAASLMRVQAELATLVPAHLREQAELNSLVYSRRFAELQERSEVLWKDAQTDLDRRRRFLDALLLNGSVEAALERCEAFIGAERPPEDEPDPHAQHYARVLLRAGRAGALSALRPDLGERLTGFALAAKFKPPKRPVADLHCINLERDVERLKRAEAMLAPGLNFHRSPGVSGSSIPNSLLAQAGIKVTVGRRAQIGCHLGHIAAWETIAAKKDESVFSLVTEDDAVFIMGPPYGLREAIAAGAARKLEILFVNWEPTRYLPQASGPDDIRLFSVDETLEMAGNHRFPGWGGQGYLITPEGARKLIKTAYRVGIVAPLDWQIALYAMDTVDPNVLTNTRYGEAPVRLAEARAENPDAHRLKGAVINLPLLIQSDFGYTAHNYEVGLT